MEKVSIKTKLIILIVLICGFILLINSNTYAAKPDYADDDFYMEHYQRNLFINKQNEKGLRDGVIKIPLVNKTGKKAIWYTLDSKIATVNQFGYVTGLNPGLASIVARVELEDRTIYTSCNVFVRYDGRKVVATANKFAGYNGAQIFNLIQRRTGMNMFNVHWDALFVSYVYDLNYGIRSYKTIRDYCFLGGEFTNNKQYVSRDEGYIPEKGDVIIFGSENNVRKVGIVTSYDAKNKRVYTIQGDIGNAHVNNTKVGYRNYDINDSSIKGYYSLNYSNYMKWPK